jgi:hypothetical protein
MNTGQPISHNTSEVKSLLLLYASNSKACQLLMQDLKQLGTQPPYPLQPCDVSGNKARRLLSSNGVLKIDGVPVLLVVKADGEGEVFKGRPKIIQWFLELEEALAEEDPMIGVPDHGVPENSKPQQTSQLEFAFANDKTSRGLHTKKNGSGKGGDIKALAKKMQEDRARTYGYDDTPNQSKLNQSLAGPQDEEVLHTNL